MYSYIVVINQPTKCLYQSVSCLQNGYTPLIKAIAHGEMRIAEWLLAERPELRGVPDNVRIMTVNVDYCSLSKHSMSNNLNLY